MLWSVGFKMLSSIHDAWPLDTGCNIAVVGIISRGAYTHLTYAHIRLHRADASL